MAVIEVANLVKRYRKGERNAVDGVSFSVEEGEFFAFLGPNGAGKTTTISILTTSLAPSSGSVNIAGYDLLTDSKDVRRSIGVIFQNPSLDKKLTAEENVRLHAMMYGLYSFRPAFRLMPKEYRDKVYELAELLDIRDALFRSAEDLSGGMKRKFEIIRSLIHRPKVLFLDEPTSGLDPLSRSNLWEYLNSVRKKEGVTIFLTTHYLDEAEGADRVCIINKGQVVLTESPKRMKEQLTNDYLILDAEDRGSLRRELEGLDVSYTEDGVFRVDIHGDAQRIIRSISTKLSTLDIYQPTLEEAYINLIDHDHDA